MYDRVLANPPFSLDDWGRDQAEADKFGRFHYGVPSKSKGDLAFLQHMLAVLNGEGRMAVVMPHGVLFRGAAEGTTPRQLDSAPPGVSRERLARVVRDKAAWIVERLRRFEEHETPVSPRQWVSGESITYLGRHYRLRVREQAEPRPAKLERGWLVVEVEGGSTSAARAAAVHEAVRSWYLSRAQIRLRERAEHWAERVGVELGDLIVKDQAKRWGSCDDKGVLRFNWRVIQAPMRLVDYVVAHELIHVIHRDHTKAFWARLGVVMPDYERRKDELRKLGARLA